MALDPGMLETRLPRSPESEPDNKEFKAGFAIEESAEMSCHNGSSIGIRHCFIHVYFQCNTDVCSYLIVMDYFNPTSMTMQNSAMLLIS